MAATDVFIGSIESLLNDMERLSETPNPDVIDSMISRLQCASDTTNQLMHRSTSNYTALSSLYQHLLVFLESWLRGQKVGSPTKKKDSNEIFAICHDISPGSTWPKRNFNE